MTVDKLDAIHKAVKVTHGKINELGTFIDSRIESRLDAALGKLKESTHTTRDTAIIMVGVVVGWDMLKWLIRAIL